MESWRKLSFSYHQIPSVSVLLSYLLVSSSGHKEIWAATWQNQQSDWRPSEDSDQPGHPPSLIRVFAVRSMGSLGPKLSSCGQWRLWSDWADAQADQSLRWVLSHIVGFVMSRLILSLVTVTWPYLIFLVKLIFFLLRYSVKMIKNIGFWVAKDFEKGALSFCLKS